MLKADHVQMQLFDVESLADDSGEEKWVIGSQNPDRI
jgi:hypothetical protein